MIRGMKLQLSGKVMREEWSKNNYLNDYGSTKNEAYEFNLGDFSRMMIYYLR